VLGLLLCTSLASSPSNSDELKDLYFGEALYYAHQGYYFDALERLDTEVRQHGDLDEPELDTLYFHINDAEFSLGDFELRYRMHHRAGRAITAVLEGAVDELVRNDAAYRLARIHFQKGQMDDALRALQRIDGRVPEGLHDEIEFLRANIYLAQGKPGESFDVLRRLQDSDSFGGFASYNLGIAYLQDGQREMALEQLDRAGQIASNDPAELAIRDKSNLVLGTILLEDGEFDAAMPYLNRVRLDGPFSGTAQRRLGEPVSREIRKSRGSLEHPGRARGYGRVHAGSHAGVALCIRQAGCARAGRRLLRSRTRCIRCRGRKAESVHREHPRRSIPRSADS
jgi:tetratricopeptide (TPR) repeat protein